MTGNALAWAMVLAFGGAAIALRGEWAWLAAYPVEWVVPVADAVNAAMDALIANTKPFFRALSAVLDWPLESLQAMLAWLPWPATIAGACVLAHYAAGWRLAAFTLVAMLYMVITGYWDESMNTLALVFVSVPLAMLIGFALGFSAYRWHWAARVVDPLLDLMQTVPTFAYLIPILLLFGFGPVVGLIASAIYAAPPMVRNVALGLRRVPSDIVESAQMSGASPAQVFWWAKVPSALPTIMVGVNQTTMAALSMVIIAAIIGGFADIGWEVLSTMRKAQFGQSLLAGTVIALIAMVMDRIGRGFTDQARLLHSTDASVWVRHRHWAVAAVAIASFVLLAWWAPPLRDYPDAWRVYPAEPLNRMVDHITANYFTVTDAIKNTTVFYFMLPIRIGLENAVSPFSWGMEFTPAFSAGFGALMAALAGFAAWRRAWPVAIAVVVIGAVLHYGIVNIPWPAVVAVVTLAAWQVGGPRTAAFAFAGLLFMAATGVWVPAMTSVYLCGAAVVIAFAAGGAIGVWAAHDDRVSTLVRPINDTLQTMPLFVFLIPVLMFFQVGEFTALLAIIAYAIVPAVRYTEHGLRRVHPDIVEAARSIGCTGPQMLWQVKLPLAIPEIMLGLNQTIMFGLAMLVITALVGTKGLGQQVYIALTDGNAGSGVVAGLSMALIAMIADRIIQAWAARRKAALGIT